MRMTRPGLALSSAVISCLLFADVAAGQGTRKAPRINLNTALGGAVATNYIEPSVTLSEDAYVFVISVDVDRNIQVLHPTDIDLSVRMAANRQLHLPRFFAGFGEGSRFVNRSGGYSSYDTYASGSSDTRGTLIALASRAPFNLRAISIGGRWDHAALRRLVDDREPYSAASALARYLGAPGEPIGRDVYRFAGGARHYFAASAYDCHPVYGAMGYGHSGRGVSMMRAYALRQAGYQISFLGFDSCGQPRYAVSSVLLVGTPAGNPPAAGSFPVGRLPSSAPRNPAKEAGASPGQTVFSRPARGGYADADDTPSLPTRVSEPREVSERFHPQPARETVSDRPRRTESNSEPRPERASQPAHTPERAEPRSVSVSERPSPPAYNPPPERSAPPPAPAPTRSEPVTQRERPTPVAAPPDPADR